MLLADGGEERGFCDAWAWWARCTLGRASASRERQGKTGKRQLDRKTAQDSVAALASPCAGALCLAHTMNVGRLHKGSCHALHTQASCLSHATDKTFCSSLQQSTRPMEHRHRRSDISSVPRHLTVLLPPLSCLAMRELPEPTPPSSQPYDDACAHQPKEYHGVNRYCCCRSRRDSI